MIDILFNYVPGSTHLQAIAARPALAASLLVLTLGDSDTGSGYLLNNRRWCSSIPLFNTQPPLPKAQRITGNDKVPGRIDSKALKTIRERPDLGANLKELVLYDQHINGDKETKATTKARKRLVIRVGETLGDGIADNMIAVMTGGAMTTAWKNGKMVDFGVDEGFYGSGGYDMPFF
ncbi:hypothetical protein Moror_5975 [Moniliophthora roreri MCA 2997]|uniref:Uncharacterized protein n=1 Tax=Moniliophthora roreri (strain MCA 2997) TaxID=1381753 RepID=V2WET3_MONRO|nr:hypothetical protein Moror_5975 [Moniliophthora roreri MCA 2997]